MSGFGLATGLGSASPAGTSPDKFIARVLEKMGSDKKNRGGEVRFVLLRGAGDAFFPARAPLELVREVLSESFSFTA